MRTLTAGLLAATVLGCSRNPASTANAIAPAADGAIPPTQIAGDASPPGVETSFREGVHDYRGTVGQKISIAAHLVRSAQKVEGFYVYASVAQPIALSGAIDSTGALLLTESVAAQTTGTMHLRATGDDLAGEWTSPKGDKVLPVRLSPGSPWLAAGIDAGASLDQQAEACLSDPLCPAAEADRLFVLADQAKSTSVDCHRFLDGAGTRRDLARGRACIDRSIGKSKCEGPRRISIGPSSPSC